MVQLKATDDEPLLVALLVFLVQEVITNCVRQSGIGLGTGTAPNRLACQNCGLGTTSSATAVCRLSAGHSILCIPVPTIAMFAILTTMKLSALCTVCYITYALLQQASKR